MKGGIIVRLALLGLVAVATLTTSQPVAETRLDDATFDDEELNAMAEVLLDFRIDCEPDCENGGACIDTNVCECPVNFSGKYCEIRKAPGTEERTLMDLGTAAVSHVAKKSLKKFKKTGLGRKILEKWGKLKGKLTSIATKAKGKITDKFSKIVTKIQKQGKKYVQKALPRKSSPALWKKIKEKIKDKVPNKVKEGVKKVVRTAFSKAKNLTKEIAIDTMKAAAEDWIKETVDNTVCSCLGHKSCKCCLNIPGALYSCVMFDTQPSNDRVRVKMNFGGKRVMKTFLDEESADEDDPTTTCAELAEPWNILDVCLTPVNFRKTLLSPEELNTNVLKKVHESEKCQGAKSRQCKHLGRYKLRTCFIISSDLLELSWPKCLEYTPGKGARLINKEFDWWAPAKDKLLG